MKTNDNFWTIYIMMLICQVLISNYFQLTPYIMLTMLPAMVLCIPLTVNTISCMIIAFFSGLAVDWLSEGLLGLNAASLVPVALMRKGIIRIFLGEDIISRSDSFSFKKNGFIKISVSLISCMVIFLAFYIILDGAGTRTHVFNLIRFASSLICGYILSALVTNVLSPDDRK